MTGEVLIMATLERNMITMSTIIFTERYKNNTPVKTKLPTANIMEMKGNANSFTNMNTF